MNCELLAGEANDHRMRKLNEHVGQLFEHCGDDNGWLIKSTRLAIHHGCLIRRIHPCRLYLNGLDDCLLDVSLLLSDASLSLLRTRLQLTH